MVEHLNSPQPVFPVPSVEDVPDTEEDQPVAGIALVRGISRSFFPPLSLFLFPQRVTQFNHRTGQIGASKFALHRFRCRYLLFAVQRRRSVHVVHAIACHQAGSSVSGGTSQRRLVSWNFRSVDPEQRLRPRKKIPGE